MGSGSLRVAVMAAILLTSGMPAAAFEEVPMSAPEKPAPKTKTPAVETPGLSVAPSATDLGTPMAADAAQGTDVQVFTFGVLPQLDFGLDVLYGHNEEEALNPTGGTETDDIGVVGTVKRRF